MSTFLPSPKTLDDIMKVQHLEGMQPEQIEAVWMEVSPGLPLPVFRFAGLADLWSDPRSAAVPQR